MFVAASFYIADTFFMETIEAILTRRSIRKYSSQKVAPGHVKELLNAGMHAPTARNIKPWHFVVVNEREMLDRLSRAHPYAAMLQEAPLAILVAGDKNLQPMDAYLVQDCSAATQNILLAAHALGLGAVWLGLYPREERMQAVGALLEIPAHILTVTLLSVGYPAEQPAHPERWDEERIHYNKF
jgi:nitroreductase